MVSFIHSDLLDAGESLVHGMGLITSDHPELTDQLKAVESQQETTIYQINRRILKELLFDHHDLLEAFTRMCFIERNLELEIKQTD